jgi:cytochrome P450
VLTLTGPIVRVNPYELSIRDADFYDKIYVSGSVRQTEIYNHFVDGVDFDGTATFWSAALDLAEILGSHFLTIPHDLHRTRRKPLEPYFSKLGISYLEPVIQDLAEKFAKRFQALEETGTIVRLDHALLCYTGDTISRLCCENPTYLLDDEDFSADW